MASMVRDYEGMSERARAAAFERAKENLRIANDNRRRAKAQYFDCLEELEIWKRLLKTGGEK